MTTSATSSNSWPMRVLLQTDWMSRFINGLQEHIAIDVQIQRRAPLISPRPCTWHIFMSATMLLVRRVLLGSLNPLQSLSVWQRHKWMNVWCKASVSTAMSPIIHISARSYYGSKESTREIVMSRLLLTSLDQKFLSMLSQEPTTLKPCRLWARFQLRQSAFCSFRAASIASSTMSLHCDLVSHSPFIPAFGGGGQQLQTSVHGSCLLCCATVWADFPCGYFLLRLGCFGAPFSLSNSFVLWVKLIGT